MIAPTSPASTTVGVTTSSRTSPLPMVCATAVPNSRGAMRFQKAAHMTAWLGRSTRVDTIVAIELVASCHPLVKSKASANRMTRKRTWDELIGTRRAAGGARVGRVVPGTGVASASVSAVLQNDRFDDIGHVFTFVSRGLEHLDDFLPLE